MPLLGRGGGTGEVVVAVEKAGAAQGSVQVCASAPCVFGASKKRGGGGLGGEEVKDVDSLVIDRQGRTGKGPTHRAVPERARPYRPCMRGPGRFPVG